MTGLRQLACPVLGSPGGSVLQVGKPAAVRLPEQGRLHPSRWQNHIKGDGASRHGRDRAPGLTALAPEPLPGLGRTVAIAGAGAWTPRDRRGGVVPFASPGVAGVAGAPG
jgi:hypothetical protein